jgi:hypothetical protein
VGFSPTIRARRLAGRATRAKQSDGRRLRLLRARRERPSSRCTAEQRDELTPFELTQFHLLPQAKITA